MEKYVIKNQLLEAVILPYGATLQSLIYRDTDVAMGFDTEEQYRAHDAYIGATVGRNANRIKGASFILNEEKYELSVNQPDGGHHHGGFCGLDKKVWKVLKHSESSLTLGVSLKDGEEGYPGNMEITVTYSVDANALNITYYATTDRDTVFNPTNHTYFNLDGIGSDSVAGHFLTVFADEFTPIDESLDTTGEIRAVEGTKLDLRKGAFLGSRWDSYEEQLRLAGGLDHNYCLRGEGFRHAATLIGGSDFWMECHTDRPGIHIYTANFFDGTGKGGYPLTPRKAVCLETQCYPGAILHNNFPSPVLKAGEEFHSVTSYRFYDKIE